MARRVMALLAVVVLGLSLVSGVAYASGNVPYQLTAQSLQTDKWIKKHCGGAALGRPGKCPNPGGKLAILPQGPAGTMVAFGDSFSAGEGAPSTNVYRQVSRSSVKKEWASTIASCARFDIGSCYQRQKELRDEIWGGASGFYPPTDTKSNACHRSPEAYAPRVAAELDLTLDFRACSGAVSDDYYTPQGDVVAQSKAPIPPNTKLITVGFGGNNVGFAPLVEGCLATGTSAELAVTALFGGAGHDLVYGELERKVHKSWTSNGSCAPFAKALIKDADQALGTSPDDVDKPVSVRGVLKKVKAGAPPGARVIAVSYPHLFPVGNKKSCGAGSGEAVLGKTEQAAINELVDKINAAVRTGAADMGVDFVDMTDAFVAPGVKAGSKADHGMCQDKGPDNDPDNGERWVNRFRLTNDFTDTNDYKGSVHPNVQGQKSYAEYVLACYRDRTACANFLGSYDWKTPSYAKNACLPRADFGAQASVWDDAKVFPRLLDVTGDGMRDVLVEAQCPTTTASNPTTFTVFDVVGPEPRVIGLLGTEHYYRDAKLTVEGRDVLVAGTSVGPQDPRCCAEHTARDVYRWDGSTFGNVSSSETSPAPPVAPAVSGEELAQALPPFVDVEGVSLKLNVGPVLVRPATVGMPPQSGSGKCVDPPPDAAKWFDASVPAVQVAYGRAGSEDNWGVLVARLSDSKTAAQYLSNGSGACRFTAGRADLLQTATGRSVGGGASWSATITGSGNAGPEVVARQVLFLVSDGYLVKIAVKEGTSDSARAVALPVAHALDGQLNTHLTDVVAALP